MIDAVETIEVVQEVRRTFVQLREKNPPGSRRVSSCPPGALTVRCRFRSLEELRRDFHKKQKAHAKNIQQEERPRSFADLCREPKEQQECVKTRVAVKLEFGVHISEDFKCKLMEAKIRHDILFFLIFGQIINLKAKASCCRHQQDQR